MKKTLASLLSLAMVASMTACSSTTGTTTETTAPTTTATSETAYSETKTADVIIVGAGGAGLSAAISAVDNGATNVIIIDKATRTGGNLNLTSGSMSAAMTSLQEECGIEDSFESFEEDIYNNGAQLGDKDLIKRFVEADTPMFEWMLEHGLSDNTFTEQNGCKAVFAPEHQLYSVQRTYKARPDDSEKYSSAALEVLDTYVATLENVEIDLNTTATKLVANDQGQVLSVEAVDADGNTILYTANKGVIMATGGYSGNFKLLEMYAPNGDGYLSSTTSMGEGIRMMQEVGAYVDEEKMAYIPTFPMGVQTGERSGTIGSTYTWKAGGICVNQNGERFVNEQEDKVDVREVALEEQPGAVQYDIFTDKIVEDLRAAGGSSMFDLYFAEGGRAEQLVQSASSLEELAEKIGVPAENLVATVEAYNASVEAGGTDEFGRSYDPAEVGTNTYNLAINTIEGDTYYAIPLKALVVMTLGGVTIDTDTHVLDENGNVIPGLYAAGEVTGGIWGKFVSGGTGVMGPITFGHIAGEVVMNDTLATDYEVHEASNIFDADLFVAEAAPVEERFDMSTALTDGDYTATVDGQEGPMTVNVTIADGKIAAVEVAEESETDGISDAALADLPGIIVENNSVNVDTISGSTLTSNRILDAVTDCLNQASAQ